MWTDICTIPHVLQASVGLMLHYSDTKKPVLQGKALGFLPRMQYAVPFFCFFLSVFLLFILLFISISFYQLMLFLVQLCFQAHSAILCLMFWQNFTVLSIISFQTSCGVRDASDSGLKTNEPLLRVNLSRSRHSLIVNVQWEEENIVRDQWDGSMDKIHFPLLHKPDDDLSSIPRTCIKVEGEN